MRRASETLKMNSATSSTTSMIDLKYKKRSGTSGISGHLYETKLISLLSHRLELDDRVEYFYLATNVYGMGAFDDICLIIKLTEHPRALSLFIQIKHKDNDEALLTLDHKTDLIKWFESFLKIKKNISSRTFCLNITESDCLFIIYTNAGFDVDVNTTFESNYASVLNSLIATSSTVGCRPQYSNQHIEDCGEFFLRKDLATLAEHFVPFLNNKINQSMHIMNDEYILQYHVILTQEVVEVSDIQTDEHEPDLKWRTLTFRRNFFDTKDKDFKFFRDTLFQEVLKKYPSIRTNNIRTENATYLAPYHPRTDELISSFLDNPTAATLSPLIITHITCNETDRLEFLTKRPITDVEQLQTITISRHAIDKAYYSAKMAAITYLQSLQLQVPIAFGNIDLALSGSEKKIERRLKHITSAIVILCKKYKQIGLYKIVKIDDAVDNGLLSTNGGLSSAVGNILVYDKPTKFLKFSKDFTSSQSNAHSLFERLATEISNLHDYRFDVKTTKFPKMHLHCGSVVNDFLNQLIVYPKQSNHYNVERIFKKEIRDHLNVNPLHSVIKTDSVFLYYHENILKWWMLPKMNTFITKTSKIYENTINGLIAEQCVSKLQNIFYMSNLIYFGFSFNENATKWMELSELPSKIIITTSTVTLTSMKVIQCLRSHYRMNKYAVLDLEHVFKLPVAETLSMKAELETIKIPVIFVCREKDIRTKSDLLNEIIESMRNTTSIIITDDVLFIKDYFLNMFSTFNDDTQCLTALTPESQRDIRRNAEVIVQNKKVSLDLVIDDHSVNFIKGYLLDRIIRREILNIGTPLNSKSYRDVKSFYINRRISLIRDSSDNICDKVTLVRTFYDIRDDIVFVTAAPGMGKSTLLTHLSLETQQCEEIVWIVRVNFLDHSNKFYKWHKNKTVVDPSESLKFLCQVALSESNILFNVKIANDEAHLVDFIGDESANFALNIFLIFYNKRKLIFVFDGFDEICPDYKNKVIDFLNVARNKLRKKKMWVTSRPYSDILPDLKKVFNKCFKLEHLNNEEQELYLIKYWKQGEITQHLKFMHSTTLLGIVENMEQTMLMSHNWIIKVFCIFYNFVHRFLSRKLGGDEVLRDLSLRFARRYNNQQQTETETLTGIPLLLHLIATQFIKMILSRVVLNRYNIYQMFIKSKIYEVLNEGKNKMDLSNPNIMTKCKKELNECMSSNKKLAAYAVLREPIFRELKFEEFTDMDPLKDTGPIEFNTMLNDIKTGADKIGLLSHVTPDNVPVFIHRSFTEYFASEYVCDIIKSDKFSLQKKILWLNAISECCNRGLLDWVDLKMKIDHDLLHFIRDMENMEPQALCNTSYRAYLDREQLSKSQFIRILSSTVEDYESRCFEKYINLIKEDAEEVDEQNLRNEFTRDIIKNMKTHIKKYFLPD